MTDSKKSARHAVENGTARKRRSKMDKREKVIKGLECCSVKQSCSGCPWMGKDCNDRLHLAALELLKEEN